MDWFSIKIIITFLTVSATSFSCEEKAIGQYCTNDFSGYYDCKIIPKTNFKRSILHTCGDGKKCSCDRNSQCKKKLCVNINASPANKRRYMSLSFIGSDFIWNNGLSYEQKLNGEIYEDAVNNLFLKMQRRKGYHVKWETDKFEMIIPDLVHNGTFVKYYGKKKIYPPRNPVINKTRIYRECYKSKINTFPRLVDLSRFTLVNSRRLGTNKTLQTWSFRNKRIHRTTDQVRTTWKVLYDSEKQYLYPKKFRDVKKSMPGPRLTPNQRGEIRNLVFKEHELDVNKENVFQVPEYCKDIEINNSLEGFI